MKFSNVPINLKQSQTPSANSAPPNPYQSSLNQAIEQRRRLKATEYSSADPIQTHARQRGEMLERRINQLQQKTED